jgi:hypothetical protein
MRHLYRITPAENWDKGTNATASSKMFFLFADDSAEALMLAFDHTNGIAVPDREIGWTVRRLEGTALEAEE